MVNTRYRIDSVAAPVLESASFFGVPEREPLPLALGEA
jgi:hypothetical protein